MKINFVSKTILIPLVFSLITIQNISAAQQDSLRIKIARIAEETKCKAGVAVLDFNSLDTVSFNSSGRFPMQSVFKFPLALSILDKVDKGLLSLNQKIHIKKKDLKPGTWSPLRDKYPKGNVDIAIRELLSYTVSQSDNNGCDILFRLAGGPQKVESYIKSLGVSGIAISANEVEMHKKWDIQYRNWCEPPAMARLLYIFSNGKCLSDSSRKFLMKLMTETSTGPKRIKGLLPEGTVVAHKTGSSGSDKSGLTAAANDAGIVTLPGGKQYAIAVFISDTYADEKTQDAVIARISRCVWDYFLRR
jgi:beta-lactamase class A